MQVSTSTAYLELIKAKIHNFFRVLESHLSVIANLLHFWPWNLLLSYSIPRSVFHLLRHLLFLCTPLHEVKGFIELDDIGLYLLLDLVIWQTTPRALVTSIGDDNDIVFFNVELYHVRIRVHPDVSEYNLYLLLDRLGSECLACVDKVNVAELIKRWNLRLFGDFIFLVDLIEVVRWDRNLKD